MHINKLGEFNLLNKIFSFIRRKKSFLSGPGDDAVLIPFSKNKTYLVTTDTLIENIHFKKEYTTWKDLAYKGIAINLSDFSAMGNVAPKYCLITTSYPGDTDSKDILNFYKVIEEMGKKYNFLIVGGDTSKSEKIMISITLIGVGNSNNLISRRGAKEGDLIFVTGSCGDSAAGLWILKNFKSYKKDFYKKLVKKHKSPPILLDISKKIALNKLATSMIDLSDGLPQAIDIITKLNRVGAKIFVEDIPVSDSLKKFCQFHNFDTQKFSLSGSEDYQLLFTSPAQNLHKVKKILPSATFIGVIMPDKFSIKYFYKSNIIPSSKGYDHFLQ